MTILCIEYCADVLGHAMIVITIFITFTNSVLICYLCVVCAENRNIVLRLYSAALAVMPINDI